MVKISSRQLKRRKKLEAVRSMLVYRFLKSKNEGLSSREILNGVIDAYNLSKKRLINRQVRAALRRGVDFGIVMKIDRKYRFDPDSSIVLHWQQEVSDRSKKKPGKTVPQKKQPVPRPRVPRPPSFQQRKRNLREEPMPRIRKHTPQDPNDPENPAAHE